MRRAYFRISTEITYYFNLIDCTLVNPWNQKVQELDFLVYDIEVDRLPVGVRTDGTVQKSAWQYLLKHWLKYLEHCYYDSINIE